MQSFLLQMQNKQNRGKKTHFPHLVMLQLQTNVLHRLVKVTNLAHFQIIEEHLKVEQENILNV